MARKVSEFLFLAEFNRPAAAARLLIIEDY
jgi:hypothetical protein